MSNWVTLAELPGVNERVFVDIASLGLPSESMTEQIWVNHKALERATRWSGYSALRLSGFEGDQTETQISGSANPDGSVTTAKAITVKPETSISEASLPSSMEDDLALSVNIRQRHLAQVKINRNALRGSGASLADEFDPKCYANLYNRGVRKELKRLAIVAYAPTSIIGTFVDAAYLSAIDIPLVINPEDVTIIDKALFAYQALRAATRFMRNHEAHKNGDYEAREFRVSLYEDIHFDRIPIAMGYTSMHRFFAAQTRS